MRLTWNPEKLITASFAAFILIGIPVNLSRNGFYDNSWTIGEWLINYAGGFVRRGLPGHVIYLISSTFYVNPVYIAWAISIFSYISLSFLLWIFCKNKIPYSLLLSPVFLLAPITADFFVRKDLFVLACYGLSLFAIKQYCNINRLLCWGCFFTVNLVSLIAIFSHESYGFFALPSLVAIIYVIVLSASRFKREALMRSVLFLSPSILAFVFCLTLKGSTDTAIAIHESWQRLSSILSSQGALSGNSPIGAIDAIGWSTNKGLLFSISTLNDFSSIIWVPAAWFFTIYACASLIVGTALPEGKGSKLFRIIVIFQLIMFIPLFILGWDYGRWIFMWTTSSALLYGFTGSCFLGANLSGLYTFGSNIRSIVPGIRLSSRGSCLLLFAGIPGCCWSVKGFLWSMPIFYFFNIVRMAIKSLLN